MHVISRVSVNGDYDIALLSNGDVYEIEVIHWPYGLAGPRDARSSEVVFHLFEHSMARADAAMKALEKFMKATAIPEVVLNAA